MIHDERIGVGDVYHLFRLPEDIEQRLYRVMFDIAHQRKVSALISNPDGALQYLHEGTLTLGQAGVGPVHVGDTRVLRDVDSWAAASAHYAHAFVHQTQAYPYFANRRS